MVTVIVWRLRSHRRPVVLAFRLVLLAFKTIRPARFCAFIIRCSCYGVPGLLYRSCQLIALMTGYWLFPAHPFWMSVNSRVTPRYERDGMVFIIVHCLASLSAKRYTLTSFQDELNISYCFSTFKLLRQVTHLQHIQALDMGKNFVGRSSMLGVIWPIILFLVKYFEGVCQEQTDWSV